MLLFREKPITSSQFNAIQEKTYYEFSPEFWFDNDFEIKSNMTAKLLSFCYTHYLSLPKILSIFDVHISKYCRGKLLLQSTHRIQFPNFRVWSVLYKIVLNGPVNIALYTRKNLTTCSKSANKPLTSCLRIACYKLSTSLEQVVNNL